MPSRKTIFAPGEYYHVFGRGIRKKQLFFDRRDYIRFLFLILYFQSPIKIKKISRIVTDFTNQGCFSVSDKKIEEILQKRIVALCSFAIMPNHFHLVIKEENHEGITQYMQRVLTAYSMYFNKKYETSGHVFQGAFKSVYVSSNQQLLYLSCYVHKNQNEINEYKNYTVKYLWSSYQDYIQKNRWENLLYTNDILGQFTDKNDYKEFVERSDAKEK